MHTAFLQFTAWLHLHPGFGGLAAFLIAMSESIAIVGTIIPGSITMTAIGVMIGSGILPLGSTLSFAILGAIIGDGGSYFVGYYLKEKLNDCWPFRAYPHWLDKGKAFFAEHGGKSIFIGRFIGPVRAMVPLIAGMLSMRPMRYFPVSIFSGICWAPCYLLPGYLVGIASSELPPFMATKIILLFFALLILIWLAYWGFKELSLLIGRQVDFALTHLWRYIHTHRKLHWLYRLLRSAEDPKHHGQLVLTFIAFLVLLSFIAMATVIATHTDVLHVNWLVYNFCRSIRTAALDQPMVAITTLGQVQVYILPILAIFAWTWLRHYRRLALHFAFVVIAALGIGYILKHLIHSVRPSGIAFIKLSAAFPSGHVIVATTIFSVLAWMLCLKHRSWKPYTYTTAGILLAVIFISRLYLGAHWLTDVLGGFLLSIFFWLVAIISYERRRSPSPHPLPLFIVAFCSLVISEAVYLPSHYQILLQESQVIYQEQTLSSKAWWRADTNLVPIYRANMAGLVSQVLNIQWAAELDQIHSLLLSRDWQDAHRKFPLLLNGERPALIMEKNNKILYLWPAHITLTPQKTPLFIGLLLYQVDKKQLLFHHALPAVPFKEALKILAKAPKHTQWKIILHTDLPSKLQRKPNVANYTVLIRM